MILIITHKLDFTADFLINILNQRDIAYKRLNCEDILLQKIDITFNPDMEIEIFSCKKINSVWFRRTMLPDLTIESEKERRYILNEIDAFMGNLFSILDAKWISLPSAVYLAENKLLQLKLASKLGFKIPATLVTTDKESLKKFFHSHPQIIIKPLSRTRMDGSDGAEFIFTNRLEANHLDNISKLDLTPCLFQEEIEKSIELRVTVVGNKTFTAKVESQLDEETKIDWRRKKLEFIIFELPSEIHELCVKLVKEMDLSFGAIDLILSPDGTYTFLEVNPNGQWVWIEIETGLKISDALIEHLI